MGYLKKHENYKIGSMRLIGNLKIVNRPSTYPKQLSTIQQLSITMPYTKHPKIEKTTDQQPEGHTTVAHGVDAIISTLMGTKPM